MSHMTDWQRALVSWSMLYDSIYENPDCPSDEVIRDDRLLDAWMEDQHEKKARERGQNSMETNKHKNVGVLVDSPDDARKVYKLNDTSTQNKLRQREKYIQEKGHAKLAELPDVAQELRLEKNRLEIEGIKNRNRR